ncbi:hypothetical protein EPI10_005561 [Gossypium australe]|uniref:Uncharacterized protein n=1 Tax=Gossypium australe TaxID=47621 RepID=A0A5B6WNE0_9ROSI|nr:hypothetical protein EPI10_005561 [Gossypium australe]
MQEGMDDNQKRSTHLIFCVVNRGAWKPIKIVRVLMQYVISEELGYMMVKDLREIFGSSFVASTSY